MSNTTDIPDQLVENFKKWKSSNKSNCAVIFKVNKAALTVEEDEQLENVSLDDIAEYMPESVPRFIAYSYKHTHADGRMSLPLVFIFYCPRDIHPEWNMLYSSSKLKLLERLQIMKTFDVQDSEQLTNKWLNEKLKFFD